MNRNICISIGETPFITCLKLASTYPLIEIRLDLLKPSPEEIDRLSMQSMEWIAACRPGSLTERERTVMLAASIRAGATYVDIEYEAEPDYRRTLSDLAKRCCCKIIISYHNFETTPDIEVLNQIICHSKEMGADYVKLAVTANTPAHCARIMSLYEYHDNLIAFAMGEAGRITRIAAPLLGAQFTFASIDETHKTAPAQMTAQEMETVYNIIFNS